MRPPIRIMDVAVHRRWRSLALALVLVLVFVLASCGGGGGGSSGEPIGAPPPDDGSDLLERLSLDERAIERGITNFWRCSVAGQSDPRGYRFERRTLTGVYIVTFLDDAVEGARFDFTPTAGDQVRLDFIDSERTETLSDIRFSDSNSRFDASGSLLGALICRVVPVPSTNGEGDDDEDSEPPPVPVDVTAARVLVAERDPVPGVPEATLEDLLDVDFDRSGTLVFSGNYRSSSAERVGALWRGPVDAIRLVRRAGDALTGVPDTIRFGSARSLALASDGTLGYVVRLSGAQEDDAFVRDTIEEARVLFRSGDRLQGFVEQRQLSRVLDGRLSSVGAVVMVDVEGSPGRWLWLWDGERYRAVAKSFVGGFEGIAPFLSGTRCRIYLDAGSAREPSVFAITDDGSVVFQALLRADGGDLGPSACPTNIAVVRFENGGYSVVVKGGDPVPGTEDTRFIVSTLESVTTAGTAIVYSVLSTPGFVPAGDLRWSVWGFAPSGDSGLLALQGEEVRYDTSTDVLPSNFRPTSFTDEFALGYADDGRLAALADFTRRTVIFGGRYGSGQPHASIPTPGASMLQAIAHTGGSAPPGFESSRFFASIALPGFGPEGRFVFHGIVDDVDGGAAAENAIWQAEPGGNIVELIASGQRLSGLGSPRELALPAGEAVRYPLFHDDAGTIVMVVPLNGGAQGVILVPNGP